MLAIRKHAFEITIADGDPRRDQFPTRLLNQPIEV